MHIVSSPEVFDLDGHIDDRGIQYIGSATREPSGMWRCLANVAGALCVVEVKITTGGRDFKARTIAAGPQIIEQHDRHRGGSHD